MESRREQQAEPRAIRIATRKSRLALWQAHWVQARLEEVGVSSTLVKIETQGDKEYVAFRQMQGQGFFTKAVQDAVLDGRADIAVHSLKDLPSAVMEGLVLGALPCRADVRDLLLVREDAFVADAAKLPLKEGAIVGTSAARRQAQLRFLRPDLEPRELRGNVPTRIQKLRDGQYDAIMLAQAGVLRLELDLSDFQTQVLEPAHFVPAPAQGALGIECRVGDTGVYDLLQAHLHDPEVAAMVDVERGLMKRFDGGCQLALGAYAVSVSEHEPTVRLHAFYQGQRLSLEAPTPHETIDRAFQELSRVAS